MDHWTVYGLCKANGEKIRRYDEDKEFDKALALIQSNLNLLDALSLETLKITTEAIIVSELLERVEIITGDDYQGSVSPALLLQDLDRIYALSREYEPWKLGNSGGKFYPKVRKALDLRERLKMGLA